MSERTDDIVRTIEILTSAEASLQPSRDAARERLARLLDELVAPPTLVDVNSEALSRILRPPPIPTAAPEPANCEASYRNIDQLVTVVVDEFDHSNSPLAECLRKHLSFFYRPAPSAEHAELIAEAKQHLREHMKAMHNTTCNLLHRLADALEGKS